MKSTATFVVFAICCIALPAHGAEANPWRIVKVDQYTEKNQYLGDVDRTAVVFSNGRRLEIPLDRAKPIAVLKAADGTYFLLAQGADCTNCDENTGLRFYALGGSKLQKAENRHVYPGRLYDYMDPKSLMQQTRTFYGRCLAEPHDVVVWFLEELGAASKWHSSHLVARMSKTGEKIFELKPEEGTLASVLAAVKKGTCTELPGVDGTTEP